MANEDDDFSLLDEQGRLLGFINIIDALIVLLVFVVLIAGITLAFGGGEQEEEESRLVTIDLGAQPIFVAEQISPGDTWEPSQTSDELVITDVYRTPADTGAQVTVRARINGTVVNPDELNEEPEFEFLEEPLQTGQRYNITTSEYEAEGQIIDIERTDEQLPTVETPFVIETTVSESIASEIEVADAFQLGDETVATIETITKLPDDEGQRLLLGIQGQTIERNGAQLFSGTQVNIGTPIEFVGDGYELTGTVRQRGTINPDIGTQSVVVETTVSADTAAAIAVGDIFAVGNTTVATIESRALYPAGENQRRVLLGLEISITEDNIERFSGTPVRVGNTIPFRSDTYQLSLTIREKGTARINSVTQSVIAVATVSTNTAEAITTDDAFIISDTTVATIESVATYPAGEDQRTALMGINISAVQGNTESFGGQSIRVENTIPFRTSDYELSATIRERGTTTIDTVRRPFVIETTVPGSIAPDITTGDAFILAGREVVTVESVTSYIATPTDQRRIVLGVEAAVLKNGNESLFGDQRLQVGEVLPVRTDQYSINGEIINRGTLKQPGEQTTRTVTFELDNIRPERAASLSVGLREQSRGLTTAEVQQKVSDPAMITLGSEDGDVFRRESPEIFSREHPTNRDVELEIELTVRELADGSLRFRGEPLRTGEQLTLELGTARITGEVTKIRDD